MEEGVESCAPPQPLKILWLHTHQCVAVFHSIQSHHSLLNPTTSANPPSQTKPVSEKPKKRNLKNK
uniref:Uncharacterized protein n=1 Tax=Solanum tuberosum TaxID=4113 RepID=M1ALB0_SOLTU